MIKGILCIRTNLRGFMWLLFCLFAGYSLDSFASGSACVYVIVNNALNSSPGIPCSSITSLGTSFYCVDRSNSAVCPQSGIPPVAAVPVCSHPAGFSYGDMITSSASMSSCTSDGCAVTFSDMAYLPLAGSGVGGNATTNGKTCVPSKSSPVSASSAISTSPLIYGSANGSNGTPPSVPSDCAAGTGFAAIGNQTGCLPSGAKVSGSSSTSSSPTSSSSSNTMNTYNSSTNTWSQTSTNTNSTGGTTTSTATLGSNVAGGGTLTGNGTGTGISNPNLGSDSFDNSVPGAMNNAPSAIGGLSTMTVTQYFGSAGYTCPFTDKSFSMAGQSITMPLSQICTYTDYIHYLVIFSGFIVAIRVILT